MGVNTLTSLWNWTDGVYCVQFIFYLILWQRERITGQYLSESAAANEQVKENNVYELFFFLFTWKARDSVN